MLIHEPCAYCGTDRFKRTKGHVLPRSMYPNTLPTAKRITVSECLECKKLWEDAEPHFRNIILSIWDSEMLPSDNRVASMLRSFKQLDGLRRATALLARIESTAGSERETIYPAKDPQFNLVLRRIVRGLCHEHQLETAVEDARVYCDVMRWEIPSEFEAMLTWNSISENLFRYAYAVINDDQINSFWLLHFSKHIVFFGVVEGKQHNCT